MTIKLDEFFKNPDWITAIVLIIFIVANVIIVLIQAKNAKKSSLKFINAIENLSNKIQILIDKEINTMNLPNTENIIETTLFKTEAIIKDEIIRVFKHNHRDKIERRLIIERYMRSRIKTAFNNDVNTLSNLYYKNKALSELFKKIDTKEFTERLLSFVFTVSEDSKRDLEDTLYFIDSSFNTYIAKLKLMLIDI